MKAVTQTKTMGIIAFSNCMRSSEDITNTLG